MLEKMKAFYKEYDEAAMKARKKSTFIDNFFSLGGAAQKAPCHEQFYEDIKELVETYAASQPDGKDACEMALYMIEEPKNYEGLDSYWFMYVAIGFVRELIPFMSKEDCAMLAEKMNSLYKKRDRMPVQEDTYKKLLKAGK